MARRDLNVDEESRSYAGVWLLGAVLLVVGAVWALIDDVVIRRPWKAWQTEFYTEQQNRELAKLEAEEERLGEDEAYQKLLERQAQEAEQIESGESGSKLAAARGRLAVAKVAENDADLAVRFVKSELEEAWYEYDHALETGANVDGPRAHRDELIAQRSEREEEWEATKAEVAKIEAEIAELEAPLRSVEKDLEDAEGERSRLVNRIDSMKSELAGFKVDRIPSIEQIVLPNFDVNNFEQPVARVDRCTSCHIGSTARASRTCRSL